MKKSILKTIFTTAIAISVSTSALSADVISVGGILNFKSTDMKAETTGITEVSKIRVNLDAEVADGVTATGRTKIGSLNGSNVTIDQLYVTFDNFFDTLVGDLISGAEALNFKTAIGKKAIRFGREGHLLATQTQFIDKSIVSRAITGDGYSTGEGIEFNGDLPTPAPVNINLAVLEDVKSVLDNSVSTVEPGRPLVTFHVSSDLEFGDIGVALGVDTLYGSDSKNFVLGADLGLSYMDTYSFQIDYALDKNDSPKATDSFYALTLGYDINDVYGLAVRYAGTMYELSALDETLISVLATKTVSETLKLQLQYNKTDNDNDKDTIQAQLVFNLK